ncbi:MAG: DUF438 domain-containing protein [Thermoleophilia bacterium]|nr:DUF438 domain-containing protein [Thermoleophilia bacterium]
MRLSPATKIDDLLNRYPFLLDFFLKQSPKFRLLENPLARKTVGKVATLAQVAAIGRLDSRRLMEGVAKEIRDNTGEEAHIVLEGAGEEGPPAGEPGPSTEAAMRDDERQARQDVLKGIIKDLHRGEDMAVLKQRFRDLVKDVDPSEIAMMEQALIDDGMPESEIKRLCDVHVEVFKESLGKQEVVRAPLGHPVHTFMLENRRAEEIMREIDLILDKLRDAEDEELLERHRKDLLDHVERMSRIDLHYLRKENQLFPLLEEHEIKGPSQVMWAIHDDIRSTLKTAGAELEAFRAREALTTIQYAMKSIADMIYKEENILFPMAMETLSDAEWQKVARGEEEVGYAWIQPEGKWAPEESPAVPAASAAGAVTLNLDTGQLSPDQVNLVLQHLPVELSFVDENDEVRYYSHVQDKIFPRSPGVIGRKVQNCHPAKSLHLVQRILDEFRAGTRNTADFWIESGGRFIYIIYYAVRDGAGDYRGTLEVVQDATEIRGLTGEKRLLDWE